ncbi:hypothetical protein KUV47_02855 [Vannielia litorea]|uniref:hypothetical protein n=1 Tax=Vannielia TaxID=2813041 RepID=UPI001C971BA9|nr:hypothetical protein [Vannielia litorea]MBY6047958.1 hypothetical protein [Vannielia litorea]MBY6075372.1 hypothetical protein [Vannielia litorea]MBY6152141.1 hypothetical protein [Vannielia litorea]
MTHDPLVMSGHANADGTGPMGILSPEQMEEWIAGKLDMGASERKSRGSNIKSVVAAFMDGAGKATSGPNKHVPHGKFQEPNRSHTSKYRGHDVYHTSSGKIGKSNGITIFYVNPQGHDGKIIGIGNHINSTTYEIEWHVRDWHVGRTVSLG